MMPQSKVATRFVESLGSRKRAYKQRTDVHAIVVHTTGSGPIARWKAERNTSHAQSTPFLTAVHRVYGQITKSAPHYVVGQAGDCVQLCVEDRAAWHVSSERAAEYRDPSWVTGMYEWWAERWPEIEAPIDLAGGQLWKGGSCNDNTIGIEVVPPPEDTRAPWSAACWSCLSHLVRDIAARHAIPFTREHVVTHSDAHPLSRTSERTAAPWDPGPRQWPGWPSAWSTAAPLVG